MPTQKTLDKYGLTLADWEALYNRHNGACWICGKAPSTGRLNIDHAHVKGWAKMPPQERKKYVRGLLCFVCNHRLLTRGVTIKRLQAAIEYLEGQGKH